MKAKTFAATILSIACMLTVVQAANAVEYRVMKPKNLIARPNPNLRLAPLHVKCAAVGSPEFVHYAALLNDGVRPIPAGSTVHWVMGTHAGNYTFGKMLPVHKSVAFNLHFDTSATHPCKATFLH